MSTEGKSAAGVALAACVSSARHAAHLSQEDLARAAGIGTSTLRQIESGKATGTSIFIVFRLLSAAGSSLESLDDAFVAAVKESPQGSEGST